MAKGVSGIISSTAYIAADEADPQISIGATDATFIEASVLPKACAVLCPLSKPKIILGVTADRTARSTPLLETGAVEDVLAEDCEETCRFVHTLEANGARW